MSTWPVVNSQPVLLKHLKVIVGNVVCRQASMATFHNVRHAVTAMHLDEDKRLLLTVGKDRLIKVSSTRLVLEILSGVIQVSDYYVCHCGWCHMLQVYAGPD